MKELKMISESEALIDGRVFVLNEPEFKVGQWVIANPGYCPSTPALITWIEGPRFSVDNFNGHKQIEDSWIFDDKILIRPATPAEIESHLKKICEKYVGKKVRCVANGTIDIITNKNFRYIEGFDKFWVDGEHYGMCLYSNGTFADILPLLKKKPETKEEYIEFIEEWHRYPTHNMREFVNQYDIK